jgi:hypothetical protein
MDRNPILSSKRAAGILGVTPARLRQWRWNNVYSIPYIKIGNRCFYYLDDLEAFLKNKKAFKPKPKSEILRRGNRHIEAEPL